MSQNAKMGALESPPSQEVTAAGGTTAATVTQAERIAQQLELPRVAGRLDTYRSKRGRWHRQASVEHCPGCGCAHLHRAPLPLVRSILRTGPCGMTYVVVLRAEAVVAA